MKKTMNNKVLKFKKCVLVNCCGIFPFMNLKKMVQFYFIF